MYVRFPTITELISSSVLRTPPQDIPRLLGISPSAWYAYRTGARNPDSRRDSSLLRSNVAALVAKAMGFLPSIQLRADEYTANLFQVQDFFYRLDALFPQVLPRLAARLTAQLLAKYEKTSTDTTAVLEILLKGEAKKARYVVSYLLSKCPNVIREEYERRASGELFPARRVSLPLDPAEPVRSFLKLTEETFEKDVVLLPSPWYLDVAMCCAEQLSFSVGFYEGGEGGGRVVVKGHGEPRKGQGVEVPGFNVTVY